MTMTSHKSDEINPGLNLKEIFPSIYLFICIYKYRQCLPSKELI